MAVRMLITIMNFSLQEKKKNMNFGLPFREHLKSCEAAKGEAFEATAGAYSSRLN
jgi:hypothetical protein